MLHVSLCQMRTISLGSGWVCGGKVFGVQVQWFGGGVSYSSYSSGMRSFLLIRSKKLSIWPSPAPMRPLQHCPLSLQAHVSLSSHIPCGRPYCIYFFLSSEVAWVALTEMPQCRSASTSQSISFMQKARTPFV